jgi:CubicO group peptidase (beta-lactamase class C family)
MFRIQYILLIFCIIACQNIDVKQNASTASAVDSALNEENIKTKKLLERANSLELDTPYNPPPGDADSHHASGFAKILCSAVFVSGLDFDFAAEAIGYFSSPYDKRQDVERKLDLENKAVHVTLPNGVVRTAKLNGDLGCVCLPEGEKDLLFKAKPITKNLPNAATTPWPMGDDTSGMTFPESLNKEKIQEAVNAAFNPSDGLTASYVVTHKGQIIGERYKDGIDMHTSLESWSMGKSLTAMMMGVLIQQGVYDLWQAAPIPEWQSEEDQRQKIRIGDIMRMSSGIRFRAPQDPDFDPKEGYPDHLYVYTNGGNTFEYIAALPQQWEPNTVGRYRNCDPGLTNYLIRLGVEGRGQDYHSFPQREIFDKIGVQHMVMETDNHGNFLLQGYEFGTARDWARLGNLMLNDGVWNGERILPEGYREYANTIAPAWLADDRPIYGGAFCWVNGDSNWPIPKDAFYFAGAGGQFTIIIPSHDLVVVRLGHYKGSAKGVEALKKSLALLIEQVPVS